MREMKDSGILGVGKVPIFWGQSRLSYECYIRARLGWRGLKADEYVDEGYAFISAFNIQNGKLVWEPLNFITQERYDESPEIKLNIGDVLLVKDGAGVGKSARVDSLPCGGTAPNSSIGVITPYNSMSYRYVCYYIQSSVFSNFVGLLYNGMGVPHLTQEILKSIRILIPSLDEQQVICNYLDTKCSEIDALVADIQKQIDTLEEYKRSVITEAVTKGLDRDVEMRDSGDEWIGSIPNHWKIIRIGRLFRLRNEKNHLPMDKVQLLSLYTGIGVFPHGEQEERGNKAVTVEGYSIVKKNDIVVNIILAWMGAIGISNYNGVTSPAYDVYVPDLEKVVPHYFHYVFRTPGIAGECYKYGRGIMMMRWRTYSSEFKQIHVPFPDIKEQQQIADYLDKKCTEIDTLISEKKQQIATIEEYKKSLIFEYVTGKKEVTA